MNNFALNADVIELLRGEFSFILATTGLKDGIFNEFQNSLFITIAVISMTRKNIKNPQKMARKGCF